LRRRCRKARFPDNQNYQLYPRIRLQVRAEVRTLSAWIDKEAKSWGPFCGFALAQKLALSIHQIHTSGWLHKKIYSANIAFFSNASEKFRLDSIYIIGFGKARPDNDRPDAQTVEQLDIPGSSFDLAPNYQSGGSLYRQAFDVYNFGILLVEMRDGNRTQ
jgi:serine/threonine protein kinase